MCNTEKDKHIRLNYRKAGTYNMSMLAIHVHFINSRIILKLEGILAAIRPCGVIVLLSELYTMYIRIKGTGVWMPSQ